MKNRLLIAQTCKFWWQITSLMSKYHWNQRKSPLTTHEQLFSNKGDLVEGQFHPENSRNTDGRFWPPSKLWLFEQFWHVCVWVWGEGLGDWVGGGRGGLVDKVSICYRVQSLNCHFWCSRLLLYQRNTWLRMIYCLQTIWQLLWGFPVPELNVLHQHQL